MKWLGLPLMLVLALTSPAAVAAGCASQSAALDTTCACCTGPDSCCLDSNAADADPLKTPVAPAPGFAVPAAPAFVYEDWFTPPPLRQMPRSLPPRVQTRPPPDPVTLCTFLI